MKLQQKINIEEVAKLTLRNILSSKGIIYKHYENKIKKHIGNRSKHSPKGKQELRHLIIIPQCSSISIHHYVSGDQSKAISRNGTSIPSHFRRSSITSLRNRLVERNPKNNRTQQTNRKPPERTANKNNTHTVLS